MTGSLATATRDSRPAEVFAELGRDLRGIEAALAAAIGTNSTRIDAAARHSLLDGGKRVRPLLTCAVLRALGRHPAPHVGLIVAVEMAHAGSLLHDDVIDASRTRRGRLTAHLAFDVPTAVLAGDRLVMLAVERLTGGPEGLLGSFCAAVRDLCIGESLERDRRFDATVDLEDVRRVNRLKTAVLFAYAAEAGARLAGTPPPLRRAARAYGEAVGEAFQTTDDYLDFCGDPRVMGKSIGRDLVDGVVTVPVAIALERCPALREDVQRIWQAPPAHDHDLHSRLARLRDRMHELGAFSGTLRLAGADADRAATAMRSLPAGRWRDHLLGMARAVVQRSR